MFFFPMSMAIPFDTLAFVRKLTRAGVPSAEAEAQVETLAEIIDENLATKSDIADLATRIDESEMTLRRDIKESEMRLMIRLGALLSAAIAIVATLVKLL